MFAQQESKNSGIDIEEKPQQVGKAIEELKKIITGISSQKETKPPSKLTLEQAAEKLAGIDPRLQVQEVFESYARGVPRKYLELYIEIKVAGREIPINLREIGSIEANKNNFSSQTAAYSLPEEIFSPPYIAGLIQKKAEEIASVISKLEGPEGKSSSLTSYGPARPFAGIGPNQDGYTAIRKPNGPWQLQKDSRSKTSLLSWKGEPIISL